MSIERMCDLARQTPGLRLLVLYGSRARGDARADSDWDVGYLATPEFDPQDFLRQLTREIDEPVDLVDLERVSGVLRHEAAKHGTPLFEATPGMFEDFVLEVLAFWLDAEPVLNRAYDSLLTELAR